MRKILCILAITAIATPAMADIGFLNANHTGFAAYGIDGANSSSFTLTMGIHVTPTLPMADMLHFGFFYDADEVDVTSVTALAPWQGKSNNVTGLPTFLGTTRTGGWNIGTNYISVGTPLAWGTTTLVGTTYYPIAQWKFHIDTPNDDGYYDFYFLDDGTLYYYTTPSSVWSSMPAGNGVGGFAITPEPASLSVLALGALGIGGGIWRRRR